MTNRHSSNDDRHNYTKLDNDFVRNADQTTKLKAQLRKRKIRRIVCFMVVPVIIIAILMNVISHQKDTLLAKEKKKAEVERQLTKVEEQQEMLNLQIKQLEDDEYVAKLLRKEYFLSEEGDIIFVIPEKEDKKDN